MDLISETVQTNVSKISSPKFEQQYNFKPAENLLDLKLFTKGQPWELFSQMRKNAPQFWHPGWSGDEPIEDKAGFWAITRHQDVQAVSRDTKTFSSQRGGIQIAIGKPLSPEAEPLFHAAYNNMICMDGNHHSQLRKDHMPFFTPDYVSDLQRKAEVKVAELLDEMAPLGSCDLVEMLSAHLPLFTLSEILGIPEEDRPKLVKWMHYLELASYITSAGPDSIEEDITPELIQGFLDTAKDMFEYGRHQLHGRRKSKQKDLLNTLAWAEMEGSLLNDQYLDGSWLLIVFAGNDTTRNTISGMMKLLTENPEQKAKLQANMDLMPNAIEESIRMISPVMHMRRTATCDTQIGEQKIGEGEKIVMWYGAASRDPEVFENPDQYDIERHNANQHIAFGLGKHMCIGHRVARMQLEVAYRQILTRFPDIVYDGGIDIAPNNFVHAIRKLPVRFTAQK